MTEERDSINNQNETGGGSVKDGDEKSDDGLPTRNIDDPDDRPAAADKIDDGEISEELKRSFDDDDDVDVVRSGSDLSGSEPDSTAMVDRDGSQFTEKARAEFDDNRYDQKYVVERSGELME